MKRFLRSALLALLRFSGLPFLIREIRQRKKVTIVVYHALEAGLGKAVETIAYPFGDGGVDLQAVDRALERIGYQAACLYGGGPNRVPVANPYRLTRLAIGPDTNLQAVLEGG